MFTRYSVLALSVAWPAFSAATIWLAEAESAVTVSKVFAFVRAVPTNLIVSPASASFTV